MDSEQHVYVLHWICSHFCQRTQSWSKLQGLRLSDFLLLNNSYVICWSPLTRGFELQKKKTAQNLHELSWKCIIRLNINYTSPLVTPVKGLLLQAGVLPKFSHLQTSCRQQLVAASSRLKSWECPVNWLGTTRVLLLGIHSEKIMNFFIVFKVRSTPYCKKKIDKLVRKTNWIYNSIFLF